MNPISNTAYYYCGVPMERIPIFVSWLLLHLFMKDPGGYAVHRLYFEKN